MIAALSLLRRYWWAPVILGLIMALLVQRATIAAKDAKIAGYAATMARALASINLSAERIRRARAEALAADIANARRVEAAQARATQETERALLPALQAARADAAAYAAQLRLASAEAAGGGGGEPRLPYATAAAGDPAGAGEAAELDDAIACAENTVKAEGWLAWWLAVDAMR